MSSRVKAKKAIKNEVEYKAAQRRTAEIAAEAEALCKGRTALTEQIERRKEMLIEIDQDEQQLAIERTACKAFQENCRRRWDIMSETAANEEAWSNFSTCQCYPEADREAVLTTFLSHWRAHDESTMTDILSSCALAEKIADRLVVMWYKATSTDDKNRRTFCREYVAKMFGLCLEKIESCLSRLLFYVEKFPAANKQEVQTTWQSDGQSVRIGVWGSMNVKGLRARLLNFSSVGICVDLSKTVGLCVTGDCVGILVIHTAFDWLTVLDDGDSGLLTVGGVLSVEIFAVPQKPIMLQDWTVRVLPTEGRSLRKLPSVFTEDAERAAALPSKVCFTFSSEVVLDQATRVGWWDPRQNRWRTDMISNVQFDREGSKVSFETTNLSKFTLLQPRTLDIPYRNWHCRALLGDAAELRLRTRRFNLKFILSKDGVRIVDPPCEGLSEIADKVESPASLLAKLRRWGLNLVPLEADACSLGIQRKDTNVEREACRQLGLVASFFDFCPATEATCLHADEIGVRLKENVWCEHLDSNDTELDPECETVVFRPGQCKYLIKHSKAVPLEDNPRNDPEIRHYTTAHASLFQCLMSRTHSERARRKLSDASCPELALVVPEFFMLLKILSFTVAV